MAVTGVSDAVLEKDADLAIICGYGSLPLEIARGAQEAGRRPFLIGIEGEAPAEIAAWPHEFLAWGQVGKLQRILRQKNIKEVVFAGGIHRRPELLKLKLDLGAILTLPAALGFMLGGDNTVLSGTIKLFEKRGIAVLGAHQIAPGLLAGHGRIAGRKPTSRELANIALAFSACKSLGKFDIGQAAAAEANRVVAVEGVEGTDALLERIAQMRLIGRMPLKGKNGVLVKTMKPGQDMRADLPAIGPRTIEGVVKAGLNGIAVEAGHAIILERKATLAAAEAAGIFIHGIDPGGMSAND
jgi:UDP-2,3-diacylglucosamine hydrolase